MTSRLCGGSCPAVALAIKCASLARIAGTLVEVYLGRGAGRRVLSGRILRGAAERINAVLWFSDLKGFTTIADSVAPEQVIPLLNDYAEVVISAVHEGRRGRSQADRRRRARNLRGRRSGSRRAAPRYVPRSDCDAGCER